MAVRRSGVPANSATCWSGSTDSLPCESAAWMHFAFSRARSRAAQDDVHPGDEFARAEGLGDVIIAADLEAEHAIDLVVARREKQDRNIGGFSDFPADVQAVEFRHADIQDDEVRPVAGKAGQCFLAVARLEDGHPGLLECDPDDLANMQVVVNDENTVRQTSLLARLAAVELACGRTLRLRRPGRAGAASSESPRSARKPSALRCCSTRQSRRETRARSKPRSAIARSMAGKACGPRENK